MEHFKIYCEVALSSNILNRAIKISLIVGTLLNLINQGENIFTLNFENLNIAKLLLTYFVPYGVTTYTATAMKMEFHIGSKAIIEADLKCLDCGALIHVKKDELIPECPTCGIKTHWKLR